MVTKQGSRVKKLRRVKSRCARCGRLDYLSQNRLCPGCAFQAVKESVDQMRRKSGPVYEKWVAGIKAALEKGEGS